MHNSWTFINLQGRKIFKSKWSHKNVIKYYSIVLEYLEWLLLTILFNFWYVFDSQTFIQVQLRNQIRIYHRYFILQLKSVDVEWLYRVESIKDD